MEKSDSVANELNDIIGEILFDLYYLHTIFTAKGNIGNISKNILESVLFSVKTSSPIFRNIIGKLNELNVGMSF